MKLAEIYNEMKKLSELNENKTAFKPPAYKLFYNFPPGSKEDEEIHSLIKSYSSYSGSGFLFVTGERDVSLDFDNKEKEKQFFEKIKQLDYSDKIKIKKL